jgi:hypothetical protein
MPEFDRWEINLIRRLHQVPYEGLKSDYESFFNRLKCLDLSYNEELEVMKSIRLYRETLRQKLAARWATHKISAD